MSGNRYKSIPLRRSAQYAMRHTTGAQLPVQTPKPTQSYVSSVQMPAMPDDDQITSRTPNSAIRYTDEYGRQVVQQDGRRYVMHDEEELPPLPRRQRSQRAQRHWLLFIGCGMLVMILLYVAASWTASAWQAHQLDAQYGMPRTYQVDQVVGHNNDSSEHPSHFIFENLRGRVVIIELPAGDISKAIIYGGPTLVQGNAADIPVTGEFRDMNNDGKIDMVVHIEEQTIIYLNNGTKFVPQQP